jgi:CheY-like chemotaxis protein
MLREDPATPFRLSRADRLSRGLELLSLQETELVLLDLSLPDSHGLETFSKVYAHSPKVPIIVLSGNDDQTLALFAVKSGAQDYLVKGKIDRELLLRAMQYSIERKRYQEELERQANYDALTGLPNRHLLHDRLKQAVSSQRHVRSVAGGVHRPRPLQGHQRLARPQLRRRRAAPRRRAAAGGGARRGYRGAPGRRRVRADPERPDARGRDLSDHAPHHRQGERPDDDRRAASSTSLAARASACIPRTGRTCKRC